MEGRREGVYFNEEYLDRISPGGKNSWTDNSREIDISGEFFLETELFLRGSFRREILLELYTHKNSFFRNSVSLSTLK